MAYLVLVLQILQLHLLRANIYLHLINAVEGLEGYLHLINAIEGLEELVQDKPL